MKFLLPTILLLFLTSCGKETYDAKESYELWAFESVPADIEVIHGQFWKSSHWTYEYRTYLKFRASKKWINSFIQTNNLKVASGDFDLPDQAPNWFDPKIGQRAYIKNEFSQGSIYFVDDKTGEVLIYEIQL